MAFVAFSLWMLRSKMAAVDRKLDEIPKLATKHELSNLGDRMEGKITKVDEKVTNVRERVAVIESAR